jgi:hypothetical protein
MATSFPSELPNEAPESERLVAVALRRLPSDVQVYWSVAWAGTRAGRKTVGEADFVVVVPARGVLVVEVKGGGLKLEGDRWYSSWKGNGWRGLRRDPVNQAMESRFGIQRLLGIPGLAFGHAIALPDVSETTAIGLSGPVDIVLSGIDLAGDITAATERVLAFWEMDRVIDDKTLSQLHDGLRPTVHLIASPLGSARLTSETLIQASSNAIIRNAAQLAATERLATSRRLFVYGGAGTGKTVLAVEHSITLAKNGASVRFMCHRPGLARYVRWMLAEKKAPRSIRVHDGLSMKFRLGSADVVVIDEAQDISRERLSRIADVLTRNSTKPAYVFCDPEQSRNGWTPPWDGAQVALVENCRSPGAVAAFAERLTGIRAAPIRADLGPPPRLATYREGPAWKRGLAEAMADATEHLLRDGARPNEILVIALHVNVHKVFSDIAATFYRRGIPTTPLTSNSVAKWPTAPSLDWFSNDDVHLAYGPDVYQGLERRFVVVALPLEFRSGRLPYTLSEEWPFRLRRDVYIALMRATGHITVVGPERWAAAQLGE